MAAGNIPAQQYHLTLTQGKDGSVYGRSSGSFTTVTLSGVVRGTKVCFLESWRQGGMCLVEGRLRADGNFFNGNYEDAKSHTSGSIIGTKIKAPTAEDGGASSSVSNDFRILEMVFANLLGFFCNALMNVAKDDVFVENMSLSPAAEEDLVNDGTSNIADDEVQQKPTSGSVECSSDEYEEWMNSNLLSGGLPVPLVQSHLRGVLEGLSELTGFNSKSTSQNQLLLAEACSTWLEFVTPKTLTATLPAQAGQSASNVFLQDLLNNRGDAVIIDRWVSKHVGESPFVRLGGEPMKVARRTICAAMIWHSGFLASIQKILDAQHQNLFESEVRPHENLMHIWRAAQRVIEWAIRAKNSMGSTYPVIAGLVIRKAQFLLDIEPSSKALAAASAVSALSANDLAVGGNSAPLGSTKAAVYEYAERVYSEVLMQISRFIEAPLRISSLQSKLLGNSTRAFLRTIGFLSFRNFVGDSSSSSHKTPLSAEPHDVIQSSYALSNALQWLSPSLIDHRGLGSGGSPLKDFGDLGNDVSSLGSSIQSSQVDSSHYLSGLGGCGKQLKIDLRDSFESLYSYLCASLSRATWARDSDLQLVILQAWGIIIQPDDHAFLSRVGIFRVLQTVLDEARGSSDFNSPDIASAPGTLDERALVIESKKKIVQATLKVVHLLAAQVAHAGDTADGLLSTELPVTPGLSLGSIPLLRKPSGPETLGKSVFHMLYTELKNSLEELRLSAKKAISFERQQDISGEPIESADPSVSTTESDLVEGLNDASEYCYQICTLLYSVSGSPVCRSHLSSSRWLHLLLALVNVNAPHIQRRILKLLRRLLPSLDPSSIRVRYDEIESFEMDSDDDVDTDDNEDSDHASTLISFFVGIVGSISPPSVAEAMLLRTSGSNHEAALSSTNGNSSDLAADVVLLLRSLYESPKWADYLNQAIAKALTSIPASCITESDAPSGNATDSDVEMEDMSRNVPSLDSWKAQSVGYLNALSALCVLDGHIEGIRVGGTVKVMPRSGSTLQEVAFRGARGVVVAYEPDKSAAEVLLRGNRGGDITGHNQGISSTNSLPTRPVRVSIDDLFPVPEVELRPSVFSDSVLQTLLIQKLAYFLNEIKKSLTEIQALDSITNAGADTAAGEESDDDDDMSNDGSSYSPSGMDSEMALTSGGAEESEAESEFVPSSSPRQEKQGSAGPSPSALGVEPSDILSEMEKESRLYRMLLCQHGLRASATLVKDSHCAATFIQGVGAHGLMNLLSVAISDTPTTAGVGDISSLEEMWLLLWSRWHAIRVAFATPTLKPSTATCVDAAGEGSQSNSAISGPMVQQMMEMGFPKEWCEVALARCSQNVEAAINFCFEHSSDMERLLAQYKASQESGARSGGAAKAHRRDEIDMISPLLDQLSEMGFPVNWCKKALAANRNNVDAALTWILSNGEALEAEDRQEEEAKQRATSDDQKDDDAGISVEGDEGDLKPNPLRCVSGQACIGERDMLVEGLVGGGFASPTEVMGLVTVRILGLTMVGVNKSGMANHRHGVRNGSKEMLSDVQLTLMQERSFSA
uniref:UBA domain-containing protein n=1 Tax=Globisporangium ultimum (strain ATCC 200006 / CBS 805.95 / DAOM BR144) TaxID=431595 RepID=K3X887_GLOUD